MASSYCVVVLSLSDATIVRFIFEIDLMQLKNNKV